MQNLEKRASVHYPVTIVICFSSLFMNFYEVQMFAEKRFGSSGQKPNVQRGLADLLIPLLLFAEGTQRCDGFARGNTTR